MNPLGAALITGGASLLGSVFSSETSASNTREQLQAQEAMQMQSEQFNAQQAQINRDYQTQMSNTAYQRASADMQKAGLNPMMMFGSGGAASSPSGATASAGTPTVPTPQKTSALAGVGDAVGKALNSAISMKTMDKMTEEIANLKTQRVLDAARTDAVEADAALLAQKTETEKSESAKRAFEIPASRFSAKSAEDLLSLPETLRRWAVQGGYIGNKASDVVAPIVNSASGFRRLMPSRSTIERTDSRTGDQTFTERWDNLWR